MLIVEVKKHEHEFEQKLLFRNDAQFISIYNFLQFLGHNIEMWSQTWVSVLLILILVIYSTDQFLFEINYSLSLTEMLKSVAVRIN